MMDNKERDKIGVKGADALVITDLETGEVVEMRRGDQIKDMKGRDQDEQNR